MHLFKFQKIVDLTSQIDLKKQINNYDYVKIDNKIISVMTLGRVVSDNDSE